MARPSALITGGTRGIGLGIARALEKEGYALAVNGVRPENDVRSVLESFSCPVEYVRGDVGDLKTHKPMLDQILNRFGHLNLLVNNAGIAPPHRAPLLEMSEESYDRLMDVNLKGCVFLSQGVARYFVGQKERNPDFEARIVNISSISATVVSVNRGEYCLSKAGMSMATQLFAAALGEHDIPVYEVRPGVTRSDMTVVVEEKYEKLINDGLCVQKKWGEPEDTGRVVAAIARGDFGYSTGQVFMTDGGLTIQRL